MSARTPNEIDADRQKVLDEYRKESVRVEMDRAAIVATRQKALAGLVAEGQAALDSIPNTDTRYRRVKHWLAGLKQDYAVIT